MDSHSLLAFTLVAAIAIASPGPATLVAINNSLAHGQRSAVWSSLGNGSGLFCLSAAAMLGLGALLASSEVLFNAVKIIGAGYLFYLGARQLLKKSPMLEEGADTGVAKERPTPLKLYKSAFLTAVTNPKATMFFTALFPQFIDQGAALLPQFLILGLVFSFGGFVVNGIVAVFAGGAGQRLRTARWWTGAGRRLWRAGARGGGQSLVWSRARRSTWAAGSCCGT